MLDQLIQAPTESQKYSLSMAERCDGSKGEMSLQFKTGSELLSDCRGPGTLFEIFIREYPSRAERPLAALVALHVDLRTAVGPTYWKLPPLRSARHKAAELQMTIPLVE